MGAPIFLFIFSRGIEGISFTVAIFGHFPSGDAKNVGRRRGARLWMASPDLRAYARQPARGVEVGGWRVEDWARVQAEGVDGLRCAQLGSSLGHLEPLLRGLGAMLSIACV